MKELRRLYPYLKHYRHKFILGCLFVTISNVCSTTIPRLIGKTIDLFSHGTFTHSDVTTTIIEIILLSAGSGYFMYLTRRQIIVASRLVEYDLRNDLMLAMESLPLQYFQRTPTGELMAHATNDISAVREFMGPAIMYSANTITTFLFALTMMMMISPTISLFALIPLPLVSYGVYRIGKKIHKVFREVQDQFAKLTALAQENLSGVRVVRSYVRETFEIGKFAILGRDYMKKNIMLTRVDAQMMPLMMLLVGLSQILVLGVGGTKVIRGEASVGDLIQFFIYLNQLTWPVIAIGWVTNLIQRAAASMGRLGKIFDERTEIRDTDSTDNSIINLIGSLEFKNVQFQYAPNLPEVLQNISFQVKAGETIGIVGETGSGKSTLVNLIPRLFDILSGDILIGGKSIKTIPISILRQNISIVPQESFLFSSNIADNIRFGKRDASLDEVVEMSAIAQLHNDVKSFPDGYNTIVGERGITLSGGQKQRTAIARSIIRKPSIIIFDDSLSAVDTETEEKILKGLGEITKECTTIIISHRISTVKNAHKILVLDNHKIQEIGSHEELIKNGGLYAEMHNRQLLEEEIEEF